MQVMFVLGFEFALSKSDAMAPRGLRGLAFRMISHSLGQLQRSTALGTKSRALWPTQVIDSVAANAAYGHLGLNSLRT